MQDGLAPYCCTLRAQAPPFLPGSPLLRPTISGTVLATLSVSSARVAALYFSLCTACAVAGHQGEETDQVAALSRLFDNLVRRAVVGPERVHDMLYELADTAE